MMKTSFREQTELIKSAQIAINCQEGKLHTSEKAEVAWGS